MPAANAVMLKAALRRLGEGGRLAGGSEASAVAKGYDGQDGRQATRLRFRNANATVRRRVVARGRRRTPHS